MTNDSFNSKLAAATCALLGATANAPAVANDADAWSFDSSLLYYRESDDRVTDASALVAAQRAFDGDRKLGLTLSADTLTGASASGAIPLDRAQTFTGPSGRVTYTTPAGVVPLDDTFRDTRLAANASWSQPLGRLYTVSIGAGYSDEHDYRHIGGNLALSRDFNKRNTTVSAGVAYSQDDVQPIGGIPIAFSQMPDVGDHSNKLGNDTKDVLDVLFGVTQVLGRNTALRVNYSFSESSGYLSDPYKILSVVDPLTGDTLMHVPAAGAQGPSGVYVFENRPDSRRKHSLYAEMKHALGRPVLHVAYRFMTDDWGIDSSTVDARLRLPFGTSSYVEPQLRYYTQTEADFYRLSLVSGQPLPRFASADFRLGNFDAITTGIKIGHVLPSGNEWSLRAEYYMQSSDVADGELIGNQRNREQVDDLRSIIVQLGYKFGS